MMSKFTRKMRQRRDARAFDEILRNASPSMQHELIAIASRMQSGSR